MPTITENLIAHLDGAADSLRLYDAPNGTREGTTAELACFAQRLEDGHDIDIDHLQSRLQTLEDEVGIVAVEQDLRQARHYASSLTSTESTGGSDDGGGALIGDGGTSWAWATSPAGVKTHIVDMENPSAIALGNPQVVDYVSLCTLTTTHWETTDGTPGTAAGVCAPCARRALQDHGVDPARDLGVSEWFLEQATGRLYIADGNGGYSRASSLRGGNQP